MRYLFRFLGICVLVLIPFFACMDFDLGEPPEGCGPYEWDWGDGDPCEGVVCPPDDNVCTREFCRGGSCTSEPVTNGRSCTYDGLSGVCVEGVCGENLCKGVDCDDGDACTVGTCDYVDGTCDFTPVVCDDHEECTEDTCDPTDGCVFAAVEDGTECGGPGYGMCEAGSCVAPCDLASDEEYPCPIPGLEDLFCCPGSEYCRGSCAVPECQTPDDCDDGNECTEDRCSGGTCIHEPIDCDDDNECTGDSCSGGTCVNAPLADNTPCDYGGRPGLCIAGICEDAALCEEVDCSDGNDCTDDICDPVDGSCDNPPVENRTPCAGGICVEGDCVAGSGWWPQISGTTEVLNAVSFTDANTGTVVSWSTTGTILRTTDGGTTWVRQNIPRGTDQFFGVSFADANNGTVVGAHGAILRTTDGGETWTVQDSGTASSLHGVWFTDANAGIVVGYGGTVLRTADGGETWVAPDSDTSSDLERVLFTDANVGTIVGRYGTILRTTDRGETWTAQNSGTTSWLLGVSFSDANTGTVVGSNGTILRTTDGGETWTAQDSGTPNTLYGVWFTDANNGTAVGQATFGLRGTILRTTDGGATWTAQNSGTTNPLFDVSFTDADTGTVVGDNGTILRTTDGGGEAFEVHP
jgi:photosystem II stability/assembly factor-like uncharacterized protein